MPLLIYRLCGTEIDVNNGDFNFIIRKHYKNIYDQCVLKENAIIGVPGTAQSVSLLYPLLSHFIQNKESVEDAPVLLHSCFTDRAHLFFNGSCWEINNLTEQSHHEIRNILKSKELLYLLMDQHLIERKYKKQINYCCNA